MVTHPVIHSIGDVETRLGVGRIADVAFHLQLILYTPVLLGYSKSSSQLPLCS